MNEISFTGIYNIRVRKFDKTSVGTYFFPSSIVKKGEKHSRKITVECDLTDDKKGKDLTGFLTALKKSGQTYELNCVNPQRPNHVTLYMDEFEINDEFGKITKSKFKINDFEIPLIDRETTLLYAYMAALTRRLQKMKNVTQI